jgi:putative endonuclease
MVGINRKELGKWGEEKSRQYLVDDGYRIIYLNYRCPIGEIDIIAAKENQLVFAEVKTRRSTSFGTPAQAVTFKKQMKYQKIALYFINEKGYKNKSCRFDILEVILNPDNTYTINHIPNAYQASTSGYYF